MPVRSAGACGFVPLEDGVADARRIRAAACEAAAAKLPRSGASAESRRRRAADGGAAAADQLPERLTAAACVRAR